MKIQVSFNDYSDPAYRDEAYARGFRYRCRGNIRCVGFNNFSGFHRYECDYFFFTDEKEAKEFVSHQFHPLDNKPERIFEIPPHTKTYKELYEERKKFTNNS